MATASGHLYWIIEMFCGASKRYIGVSGKKEKGSRTASREKELARWMPNAKKTT
jgi:hypothetical protein